MNSESIIDEQGRICIPLEIRKKMNIKPGEKLIFQIDQEKLIVHKALSPEQFIAKAKKLQKHLSEVTDEPIPFKKIIE